MIIRNQHLETIKLVQAIMDQVPPTDRVSNHSVVERDLAALLDEMTGLHDAQMPDLQLQYVWAAMMHTPQGASMPEMFDTDERAIAWAKSVINQRGHLSDVVHEQHTILVRDITGEDLEVRIQPMPLLGGI